MKIIIKFIRKVLIGFTGKRRYQYFFESLFQIAIYGMNIGRGGDLRDSGEISVLNRFKEKSNSDRKKIIFDVGANAGSYAQLVIGIFGNNADVYSFEPSPVTFKVLEQNVKQINNIKTYNFGLSDENKRTTLYSDRDASGLASIHKRRLDHFNKSMDKKEDIEIRTLDSFCTDQGINHIDFLKIDVEGHEMSVLKGAAGLIDSRAIEFIQFEFGGSNIDSRTFFQDFFYLLNDKYRIFRIVKDGLTEIPKYKEEYEIFKTTNYLAEKRR